ncbi:MAG TPA: hypothetical protein DCP97_05845 [Ruminococcaceae bacterium]|nr:hypothetical protein [Oscillospiraceae bacterium]
MNNKYINGFIQAIATVFESFSGRRINCRQVNCISKNNCANDILVMIGLIGDVNGSFYMSMNAEIGQQLASELLGGIEINEVDELVASAVSELCNMIIGNACSAISSDSVHVDITPPTVMLGEQAEYNDENTFYNIPVELEQLGIIDFDLNLKTA